MMKMPFSFSGVRLLQHTAKLRVPFFLIAVAIFPPATVLGQHYEPYQFTTLAGALFDGVLSADGLGRAARFNNPYGVAVDALGQIYVADNGNCTIRKITPDGFVTTLAGPPGEYGNVDGTGSATRFFRPLGLAVDGAGIVFVVDNGTVRKITPVGVVTTVAGSAGVSGWDNGPANLARFSSPSGIAVDGAGNLYVADSGNDGIRKISAALVVTTLAGPGRGGNQGM
jgi:hypothetical protein